MKLYSKTVAATTCSVAGLAAWWAWQRRAKAEAPTLSKPIRPKEEPATSQVEAGRPPTARRKSNQRLFSCISVFVSGILIALSAFTAHSGSMLIAGILLLVGTSLCAFIIRGPQRHSGPFIFGIAGCLFVVQFAAVAVFAVIGMTTSSDGVNSRTNGI